MSRASQSETREPAARSRSDSAMVPSRSSRIPDSGRSGPSGPPTTPVAAMLALQRSAGNRAVARMLPTRTPSGRSGVPQPPGAPAPARKPPALQRVPILQRLPTTLQRVPTLQREPTVQRAGPLVVTAVNPSAAELGVGKQLTARAATTGSTGSITWSLVGAPAGVTVVPRGRSAVVRSAAPVPGSPVGGASFTISAAVGSGAPVVSAPVLLVEVTNATFAANPAFGASFATAIGTGTPPPNTADPNRNGISGNTADVTVVTAPAGRAVTVAAIGSPGATATGTSIRPGSATGRQKVRVTETATGTSFDAVLVINSVPTKVSGFGAQISGMPTRYGGWNTVLFAASDPSGPGSRVIAELITVRRDDFGFGAPTGGAGAPSLAFSALASGWTDLNGTPTTIDVNRFEGPGAPGLPRKILYGQEFRWMSWTGTYAGSSMPLGTHERTLLRQGAGHIFRTEQNFPGARAPAMNDAYAGPPLIVLSGITLTPTPPATGSLAADGVSTGNLTVASTVATRVVNWSVLSGGSSATVAGAGVAVTGPAAVTAGTTAGTVRVRATDSVFPNRRGEGSFRVVAVKVSGGSAAPASVPPGTTTSAVSVTATPGGRTLDFTVDATAAAAGVIVSAPGVVGTTHTVTVTRPAGYTGTVTVTAADRTLPAKSTTVKVKFR